MTEKKAERGARGIGSISKRTDGKGYRGYVSDANGKRSYFTAPTRPEAESIRRALLNRKDAGTFVAGKPVKFGDWLDHWMSVRNHKPSTVASYTGCIERDIRPALGNIRLDKLTIEDVERLYQTMTDRGVSGKTIYQHRSIMRAALKLAMQRGHVGRNVAELAIAPPVLKVDKAVLSLAEQQAVIAAARGHRYEARWHLALEYGLRPSEVLGIEWGAIDWAARTITIRQQFQQVKGRGAIIVKGTKTTDSRTIAVAPYLMDMLMAWRRVQLDEMSIAGDRWKPFEDEDGNPHAFVFTQATGQPLRPGLDDTLWKRLLFEAMVPSTRRYAARHTAASTMVADGVDIATVAKTLGHSTVSFTLNTYVHALDESQVKLADRVERRNAERLAEQQKKDELRKLGLA